MPMVPQQRSPEVMPSPQAPDARGYASATAFGVGIGKDVQGIGQGLDQLGNMAEKQALALQAEANAASGKELFLNADIEAGELKARYNSLEGKAAAEAYPQYTKDVLAIRQKYRDAAPNGAVAKQFDQDFTRRAGFFIGDAAGYAGNQTKRYIDGTNTAMVKRSVENAATASSTEEFKSELDTIDQTVRAQGVDKGWSPEQTDNAVRTAKSQAWKAKLTQIGIDNPVGAMKVFNDNKDKIDGISQIDIEKNLTQALVTKGSHQVAQQVMQGSQSGREAAAMNYFMSQGWSREQAAGIVGTLYGESKLDPKAVGDQGTAFGIHQVRGSRKATLDELARAKGTSTEDFQTQLEHIQLELTNSESKAGEALKGTKSAKEAAEVFSMLYERPKGSETGVPTNMAGYRDRVSAATRIAGGGYSPSDMPGRLTELVDQGTKLANEIAPGNAMFEDAVKSRIRTDYNFSKSQSEAFQQQNHIAVQTALLGDGQGKVPTSMEELFQTPGMREAVYALTPARQIAVQNQLEKNVKKDVPLTEDRWKIFQEHKGMAATQPDKFADADIMSLDLPRTLKGQLLNEQRSVQRKSTETTHLTRALGSVRDLIGAAGIRPSTSDTEQQKSYNQFVGSFNDALTEFQNQHKKPPSETESREIAARLIRQETTKGWLWDSKGDMLFKQPVPEADSNIIKERFKSQVGREPTEDEIRRLYTMRNYRASK